MACVLVWAYGGIKAPVYNFSSLRVACRTALSLTLGKNPYKDLDNRFVGGQDFEIWTKDIDQLDETELTQWYRLGYDDNIKATQASNQNFTHNSLYFPPKAKTLGLKYKDYRYQIYWAAWKDAWYDANYTSGAMAHSRKLI